MYDYVIVGAGSAGCVLAHRLSADPAASVLLLEAGPADTRWDVRTPAAWTRLLESDLDWAYHTVEQAELLGRLVPWPRGKVLGGSSTVNAQVYLRGASADFDRWAALGNEGWGYEAVLPYFRRAENNERGSSAFHGVGGPLNVADLRSTDPLTTAFLAAAAQAGLPVVDDLNGPELDGAGPFQMTQKGGRRWSAFDAYLGPASSRPNLTVLTGAHTTRVILEGTRAVGVDYLRDGSRHEAEADREVILSGGAVASPQLLLLSGIGPAAHVAAHGIDVVHQLPGVGRNLQDHLAVSVGYYTCTPRLPPAVVSLLAHLDFLVRGQGRLTSSLGEAGAFVRTGSDRLAPDLELLFNPPRLRPLVPGPRWAAATVRDTLRPLFAGRRPRRRVRPVVAMTVVAVQPRSAGHLELRSSDPLDHPLIQPAYLSDTGGKDLRVLVEGVRLARRIAAAPALAPHLGEEFQPGAHVRDDGEIEESIRAHAGSLYHPVGTCRMGRDETAVVDSDLRVHGLSGLRVVDASIMPVIPRGHMNAPTIMIAEKAADLIQERSPAARSD